MKALLIQLLKTISPMKDKKVVHLEDVRIDTWVVTDKQKDSLTIIANGLNNIVDNPNMVIKHKQTRLKLLTSSLLRIINKIELIKED